MAGEWLKFESNLPEKPETLAITAAMGWDDPDLTVGKLMRLFRWFDQHTVDGNALGVTAALLDRIIGVTGFVQAVARAGWVVFIDGGVALHNFDHHNGATAKSRAQTAKRVANHRNSDDGNAPGNDESVTPALAREEKRREEISPSLRSGDKRASALTVSALVAEGLTEQTAVEWLAHRKRKRAPLTSRAWEGVKAQALLASWPIEKAVCKALERGWTGFEAEWVRDHQPGQKNGATVVNRQTALEQRNRNVAADWLAQQETAA